MKINAYLLNKNNKNIIFFSTILFYTLFNFILYINFLYADDGQKHNINRVQETETRPHIYINYEKEILPSSKVRVFFDNTKIGSNVINKQDCSIMKNKINSYGIGFKFGGLVVGMGPEVYYGHSSGIKWDSGSQLMIAEFMELCTRFNTGRLSQEEYSGEVNEIINRSRNYIIELEKKLEKRKQILFKEIDQWHSPNF
jgi:hypothetical protein